MRYNGVKQQYEAACLMGDGPNADTCRATLHALLDVMLDSTSSTMMLTRQLMETKE
jgi:hypothetical protein